MLMALSTRGWTLAELDRLPDDGNKYELVDGELFVTPTPSPAHEQLVAVLLLSQPNNGRLQLVNGLLELQELCLAVPEFLLLLVKNGIVFLHFLRELLVVLLQIRFCPKHNITPAHIIYNSIN